MSFVAPLGLLALLTIPIILLLHLLRERRRRVAVPSLLHWLNVPRRREGERIRRLPLTLLLLLHLLVAGLLGVALGRPQLPGALNRSAQQTAIVLDLSTSMATREGTATRFDQARERARAALSAMAPGDRVALVAAGRSARIVAAGGADELAGLLAALDQLRPGGTGTDLAGALTLAEAALDPQYSRSILVLTDGALTPALPPDAGQSMPLEWRLVGSDQPNRAIVAFAARPWGANLQVYARIANYAPASFATTLRLYGATGPGQAERLIGTRDISITARSETELTWTLPSDYVTLRAELNGRDGLPQDDQGFLNVVQTRQVRTILVSSEPDIMRRALAAVPGIALQIVDPAAYADDPTADLTIFENFLPQAWPAGATLAIDPPAGSPLLEAGSGQAPAARARGVLTQTGAILEGLSLGGVNFGAVRATAVPAWAEPQLMLGESPLILRGRLEAHEIALWSFDLATSNLPTRLAFPILVARTVRDLTPPPLPSSIQSGAPLNLRPDPRAAEVRISGPDGMQATVAAAPHLLLDTLTQPGFYRFEERGGSAAGLSGIVGVNAGSPIESDLRPQPVPQLGGPAQSAGATPERHMTDLWPWLALGALTFLMLEWGYIHR